MSLSGKPAMLKEINSSLIERELSKRGPLSKPKLAKITNLSLPTVNKIIEDLEQKSRVCSVGFTTKGIGRKAILYQINKDAGCIIVLYYAGEKYFCRLSDITGNTLYEETCELDITTSETAVESTMRAIGIMLDHAPSEVKRIGVGVPGVVTPEGRLWDIPKIKVWEGFNLEEMLSKRYGSEIYIENDVKLSTVGYYLTHLSDDLDNMAFIYAGNGMGSGIIINKRLYRGSTNFSGELGYMAPLIDTDPQQDYSLEGGYLEWKLNPLIYRSRYCGKEYKNSADRVLVSYFTAIAANYIAIIDPEAIVFGGEAFSEAIVGDIRKWIVNYSPQNSIPQIIYNEDNEIGINGLVFTCMENINSSLILHGSMD